MSKYGSRAKEYLKRKEQSSLSKDNLLSRTGLAHEYMGERQDNYTSLYKKWDDLYKRANDYYNNEGYKTFADKYNSTRNTEGYVNKRDADKWYRELEELNKKDNEGIEELLAELDQYSRYYNEDAVKYVRDLISEKQKAYSDVMTDAGKFRDQWAKWATEDDYNNAVWESDFASKLQAGDVAGASQMYQDKYSQNPPAEGDTKVSEYMDYINAARYNGWVDKYKNMSADELLAAKEQLSREFTGNAFNKDPMGNFKTQNAERGMEIQYVDYLYQLALDNKKRQEYAAYDADAGQAEIDYLQGFATRANEIKTQLEQVAGEINRRKAKGQRTDDLESQKKKLLNDLYQLSEEYRGATTDTVLQNHNKLTGQNGGGLPDFSDLVDFDELLSQSTADHTTAMRYRDNAILSLEPLNDPEFNSKSQYVATPASSRTPNVIKYGYEDPVQAYINGDDSVRSSIEDAYLLGDVDGTKYDQLYESFGKYADMTKDQIALYNYYYNTEGADAAKRYLKSIDEELKTSKGFSNYEKYYKDSPALLKMLYSIPAGLDQFKSGVTGIFADGYTPASPTQVTGQLIREDLADESIPIWYNFKEGEWEDKVFGSSLGQMGYDFGSTTANMLPSILASTAVNAVAPGAGAVVGAGLLGASAGGNAKTEMLNLGYSKDQAEAYGLLVGAAEGGMEYLLGGISSLGGKLPKRALEKFLTKIDNALARVAINVGREMLSEGFEEGLQTVIEPWLKEAATNVDWEDPTTDEVLYSSLLGALSSLGMSAPGTVANGIGTAINNRQDRIAEGSKYAADPQALINESLALDPNNKLAQKLQGKLESGKAPATSKLGKLALQNVNAAESAMVEQDKAQKQADREKAIKDINAQKRLSGKIHDKEALSKISQTVTKALMGEQVSNAELRKVAENQAALTLIGKELDMEGRFKVGTTTVSDLRSALAQKQSPKARLSTQNVISGFAAFFNMDEAAERSLMVNYAADVKNAQDGKTINPEDYAATYGAVYAAGKKGTDIAEVSGDAAKVLSKTAIAQAYRAGQMEAKNNATVAETATVSEKVSDSASVTQIPAESTQSYVASEGTTAIPSENAREFKGAVTGKTYSAEAATILSTAKIGEIDSNKSYYTLDSLEIPKAEQKAWIDAGIAKERTVRGQTVATVNTTVLKDELRRREISSKRSPEFLDEGKVKEAQAKIDAAKSKDGKKKKGTVIYDGDRKKLTGIQKQSLAVLDKLSETLGVTFRIFESENENGRYVYTKADGKEVSANGWYDTKNDEIWIDLNAGNNGEGVMIFTAAHELTHFIKKWSAAKFKVFAEFLIEQYQDHNISVDELVQGQIDKAKKNGRELTWDEAYEEVIADSCESFLRDSNAIEKIAELNQKDTSLAAKIKQFISNMLKRLRELMNGLEPQSAEGKIVAEMMSSLERFYELWTDALIDAGEAYSGADSKSADSASNSDVKYAERDYPIDPDVESTVKDAFTKSNSSMHELSDITEGQNSAINRLVNQTHDQSYRGKYTGGKHLFSDNAIKHIIREHGDFLREGLRAQLPMTATDIARHLSAVKANKVPSSTKASRTKEGKPSILTSYEVNGYTLYAEEIKKPLGKNIPSDLIGHTMYKAPTLPTAAFNATSAQTQPKRQSMVLCSYYTPNSTNLSTGNFVQNSSGAPAQLSYISINGVAKQDPRAGGLIALSSDRANFTDKSGKLEQGYVKCNKPFYITANNRVFSNSETNLIERIGELKKEGYDCFVFEKTPGDNYMVAVVNKAQIIKDKPVVVDDGEMFSDRDPDVPTNRELLINALETDNMSPSEKGFLTKYKNSLSKIEANEAEISRVRSELRELQKNGKGKTAKAITLENKISALEKQNAVSERLILNLEATKPIRELLKREKDAAYKKAVAEGREKLAEYKEKVKEREKEIRQQYRDSHKRSVEGRHKTEVRNKIRSFKDKLQKTLKHPTDRVYIPGALAQAMIDVCELIDTDTELYKADGTVNKAQEKRNETRERLAALREQYNEIKSNADPLYAHEYDEQIAEYLEKLEKDFKGKSLSEMSLAELEDMYGYLRSIDQTLRDARKLIGEKEAADAYEAGDKIIEEQRSIAAKRKNGERGAIKKLDDGISNQSLSPVRRVLEISGYDENSPLYKLFQSFERGVRSSEFFKMQAIKSFDPLTSGKKNAAIYENAVYEADGGDIYTDVNGRKFGISKMQKMQAVLSYERETTNKKTHHIDKGGLVFADLKSLRDGNLRAATSSEKSHKVSADSAVKLIEKFKQELANDRWAQEYMTTARIFFNETAKNAINDTYMKLKHRILATENAYIPFEVDQSSIVREISAQYDIQKTISSYGMLKDVQSGSVNPLIMTGLNNILDRHIDQVGTIQGLAVPIRNFNKVWNVKSVDGATNVREQIEKTAGRGAVKVIEQTVQDIQGERIRSDGFEPVTRAYKKVKSNYIGMQFFWNASVMLKQLGSMFSATSKIRYRDPVRMMGNFIATMANRKKISAEVDKYTASAWMRGQGLSDAEIKTLSTERKRGWFGKAIQSGSRGMIYMDQTVALSLWKYCKQDVAKKTGLRGEELLRATAEYYDEVIETTQSMSDVLHRPEIQRSGGIGTELLGTFKTDLYQNAGNLRVAIGEFVNNKTQENATKLVKAVGAAMSSAVWGSIVTSLMAMIRYKVNRYRDEEDDELTAESWLKEQGTDLLEELVGYLIPLGGSEIFEAVRGLKEGKGFGNVLASAIPYDAVNDLYSDIAGLYQKLTTGKELTKSDYNNLIRDCGNVLGIPTANIMRVIQAVKLHGEDILNGEFLSFEAGLEDPNAYRLYKAILEGDADKIDKASRNYKNQEAITKAIRSQLRERDPRIREAAAELIDGNVAEYEKIFNEIYGEDNFEFKDILQAIYSEEESYYSKITDAATAKYHSDTEEYERVLDDIFERWENVLDEDRILSDIDAMEKTVAEGDDAVEEKISMFKAKHINIAFDNGDQKTALSVIEDIISLKVENALAQAERKVSLTGEAFDEEELISETEDKAKSTLRSTMTKYWKPKYQQAYEANDSTEMYRIEDILYASGLYEYKSSKTLDDVLDEWLKEDEE